MLNLLVQFADKNHLVVEPGFAPKEVRATILFDVNGTYVGVITHKPERAFERAPEMSFSDMKALKGAGAHFLIDTAHVIALLPANNTAPDEITKAEAKHLTFVQMLKMASRDMPELSTVATKLEDKACLEAIREDLKKFKVRPTDKLTFTINDIYPVERDIWHGWWREFRANIRGGNEESKEETGNKMVCFATGDMVVPAATHPKITGLSDVGAISMGAPLIGFDKDAFASYGLEQSANGSVSELSASKYRAAINYLIEKQREKLGGVKVLYWYSRNSVPVDLTGEEDPLAFLIRGDGLTDEEIEQTVARDANIVARDLLQSLRTGIRDGLMDYEYNVLTVSGASGRVMVRDWNIGQFGVLKQNIEQWFEDLSIVNRDGTALAPRPKLIGVLAATVRDIKDIPAPRAAQIWRVATQRLEIPREIMTLALARIKIDIINNSGIRATRMGILKAYHLRKEKITVKAFLDEEHDSPAYQCGRLMAVYASLQRAALGDVGAGVVQRFYAAASTTPSLVITRLARTANFHLAKLERGLAYWYETRIANIMARIGHDIPRTLSLEDQSLFALGYYQQIAEDRKPKPKGTPVVRDDAPYVGSEESPVTGELFSNK